MKNKIQKQKQNALRSTLYVLRQRGAATLVELLIYMGMFGILLVMLSQVFVSTLEVRRESEAVTSVVQDARFILNKLEYDIKRASSIDSPATLGEQTTSLQITVSGVAYLYILNSGNITLNGVQLNGFNTSVSDLSFQRLGNVGGKHTLRVLYTVTGRTLKGSGAEVKTIQTSIGLR